MYRFVVKNELMYVYVIVRFFLSKISLCVQFSLGICLYNVQMFRKGQSRYKNLNYRLE